MSILSQDEINALLNAFQTMQGPEDVAPAAAEATKSRQVKIYDFARPDKFSKEQIRTLQMVHSSYARNLSTALSTFLRCAVQVDLVGVDQVSYDEFCKGIPNPTVVGLFTADPLPGTSIIELNPHLAFVMLNRLLGGRGDTMPTPRELTDMEKMLIAKLLTRAITAYQRGWESLLAIRPRLQAVQSNTMFAQVALPSDMVMLVTLEASVDGVPGTISVCVPILSLEPVLTKLNAREWMSGHAQEPKPWVRQQVAASIRETPVAITVELGSADLSLDEVVNLAPGDTIVLDQRANGELPILVEGRRKAYGIPGLAGRVVGVRVTRTTNAAKSDTDGSEDS